MGFKALYRTYRPQKFEELIGQDPIVKTLSNAIKNNKIGHAYIFAGPRGTGKTSTARLFAKALNCEEGQGKTCGKCPNCLALSNNSHPDVIEIDAASNNGVKEVRSIIEQVKFSPTLGKFKIYIIDEVHMMTREAFNSLLKTLEEPPSNVIFILCTTEFSKIPLTIISRCQKFEFQKISVRNICSKLKEVCEKENIKFDEDALESIASISDGCMRDALTKLDEMNSYTDGKITTDKIEEFYSLSSKTFILNFAKNILSNNTEKVMDSIKSIFDKDFDIKFLISSLMKVFKDLLVSNLTKNLNFFEYLNEENLSYFKEVNAPSEKINSCIEFLLELSKGLKDAPNINILFELTIYKMCSLTKGLEIENKRNIESKPVKEKPIKKEEPKEEPTPFHKVDITVEEKTTEELNPLPWMSKTAPNKPTPVSEPFKGQIPFLNDDLLIKLMCTANKENKTSVSTAFKERIPIFILDDKLKNEALTLKDCQLFFVSNNIIVLDTPFKNIEDKINKDDNLNKFTNLLESMHLGGYRVYAISDKKSDELKQKFTSLMKSKNLPDTKNFVFNIKALKEEKL